MKIFYGKQVRDADAFTIKHEPIASIDLMERAATQLKNWVLEKFDKNTNFVMFAGPGNNGGDALALARLLDTENFKNIKVYIVKFTDKYSQDFATNLERLKKTNVEIAEMTSIRDFPEIPKNTIIVDAIFGSGLSRPVKGFPAEVIEKINSAQANIVSIDIPSGLFAEENSPEQQTIIKATYTLTFEFPFLSFMFAETADYVGEFYVLSIGIHKDYINNTPAKNIITEPEDCKKLTVRRKKFSHKGTYGHALIIAGSYGKAGAAILAARAAHRTGAGLVTVHIPEKSVIPLQTATPETMVSIDKSAETISVLPDLHKYNAIAVGPGIGTDDNATDFLANLLKIYTNPIVIDADALNILAANKHLIEKIPKNSILTPHPKEFERLLGKTANNYKRHAVQSEFARKHSVYLILKGAYTAIACPDGTTYFNPTGTPAMATAGSGDVLTGVIVALLAKGFSPKDAAICGVYLHGLAGEKAALLLGEESVTATDITDGISEAYIEFEY